MTAWGSREVEDSSGPAFSTEQQKLTALLLWELVRMLMLSLIAYQSQPIPCVSAINKTIIVDLQTVHVVLLSHLYAQ